MKFSLDNGANGQVITACRDGQITVSGRRFSRNLIVMPDRVIEDWHQGGYDQLVENAFAELARLAPDLVILGTGTSQRFPRPNLFRPLIEAGIGLEVMTTAAACRTYNILAAEERQVAAALILED